MGQILKLPDIIVNQIAAGEVIQQPSSVIKEMMENAIDAEASDIDVYIKDAGKTLIQITDNGKGMSEKDAQMCFEAHATSKLHKVNDLYQIRTMGFRGEALSSIAAIAQVELITRRAEDQTGTKVQVSDTGIESVEPVVATQGSRFSVKNIFYNVPARRKFLGSNAKQMRALRDQFLQITLAHPDIRFSLTHNGEKIYQLKPCNLRQRIVDIFGTSLNKHLFPVDVNTDIVHIHGFTGSPEIAKKRASEQYFFVNNRCIRHPYFRKAIMNVYEPLTQSGMQPVFFLFFETEPDTIDINISPTKSEVKFENEQIIWPMLNAAVKESLGKFNATPSIDFDTEGAIDIQVNKKDEKIHPPKVSYNSSYNPFEKKYSNPSLENWQNLYQGFEKEQHLEKIFDKGIPQNPVNEIFSNTDTEDQIQSLQTLFVSHETIAESNIQLIQLYKSYILLSTGNLLLLIDQHRAQIRVLFEHYCKGMNHHLSCSQTLLFPETLSFNKERLAEFKNILEYLKDLGFRFKKENNHYLITATPEHIGNLDPAQTVNDLLDASIESLPDFPKEIKEKLALKLAFSTAISYGKSLRQPEMEELCRQLFNCSLQNFLPNGKKILVHITLQELSKYLS